MIKLSQKDFDNVFESFKNIKFELNYKNGNIKLPYSTCDFYDCWCHFKLSEKQMNQIIDYCLRDEYNETDVIRLCALFSEERLLNKTIPLKSYEYFLKKFSEFKTDTYQHIYSQVIYLSTLTFEDPKEIDPMGKIVEISKKYIPYFKISDSDILLCFVSALASENDTYKDYNNIVAFNKFVDDLAREIPINVDDFKLEDNLEKYLWKKE